MKEHSIFHKYYMKSFYYDNSSKKGIFKGIKTFIITFLLLVIGELAGVIPSSLMYGLTLNSSFWKFFVQLFVSFGIVSLVIFFYTKSIEGLPIKTLGLSSENPTKKFLIGFLIGGSLMAISTFLLIISGQAEIRWIGFQNLSTVLIIIPAWIVQSSTEEILTRGYLFTRMQNSTGNIYISLIVQAAFFSFLHIFNSSVSVIALAQIFVVGTLFAIYSLYEGSIWGACGMHAAWNWSQGNVFGWKVSGMNAEGGSILQSIATGNEILTGGNFGVEGGLVSLIVLIIAIIVICMLMKKESTN